MILQISSIPLQTKQVFYPEEELALRFAFWFESCKLKIRSRRRFFKVAPCALILSRILSPRIVCRSKKWLPTNLNLKLKIHVKCKEIYVKCKENHVKCKRITSNVISKRFSFGMDQSKSYIAHMQLAIDNAKSVVVITWIPTGICVFENKDISVQSNKRER